MVQPLLLPALGFSNLSLYIYSDWLHGQGIVLLQCSLVSLTAGICHSEAGAAWGNNACTALAWKGPLAHPGGRRKNSILCFSPYCLLLED